MGPICWSAYCIVICRSDKSKAAPNDSIHDHRPLSGSLLSNWMFHFLSFIQVLVFCHAWWFSPYMKPVILEQLTHGVGENESLYYITQLSAFYLHKIWSNTATKAVPPKNGRVSKISDSCEFKWSEKCEVWARSRESAGAVGPRNIVIGIKFWVNATVKGGGTASRALCATLFARKCRLITLDNTVLLFTNDLRVMMRIEPWLTIRASVPMTAVSWYLLTVIGNAKISIGSSKSLVSKVAKKKFSPWGWRRCSCASWRPSWLGPFNLYIINIEICITRVFSTKLQAATINHQ